MMQFRASPLVLMVIVGWALLFIYLPVVAVCMVPLAIGAIIIYVGIDGLRTGFVTINARIKCVTYNRSSNPFEFWFYVTSTILAGIAICGFAVFAIFEKSELHAVLQRFTFVK